MSFGVAAHLAEKVRMLLQPRHRWVILDAGRVPAWDGGPGPAACAGAQRPGPTRHCRRRGCARPPGRRPRGRTGARLCRPGPCWNGPRPASCLCAPSSSAPRAPSATCWAKSAKACPAPPPTRSWPCWSLDVPAHGVVFRAGDTDHDLLVVKSGHITLVTLWPLRQGRPGHRGAGHGLWRDGSSTVRPAAPVRGRAWAHTPGAAVACAL